VGGAESREDIKEGRSRLKLWRSNSDSRNGYGEIKKLHKLQQATNFEKRRRNCINTQ
jgi:hypothetical protein